MSSMTSPQAHAYWSTFPISTVVYSGIERSLFPILADAPDRQWGWRLAYLARLDPRKGVETLIRAMNDLLARLSFALSAQQRFIADAAHQLRTPLAGIKTQADPNSPTGYWRGMLAEDNDHETFAGFCSGVMADADQLPPALRAFYKGFITRT